MVGGELGIDSRRTGKIDGDFGLGKKAAPKAGRELAVTARKNSSEVVLECPNGTPGRISVVITNIGELILEVLGSNGCTHTVRNLVVEFVENMSYVSCFEFGEASIVTLDKVLCLSSFDGVDKDSVGIMVIEKANVAHSMGGCEWETAWLV